MKTSLLLALCILLCVLFALCIAEPDADASGKQDRAPDKADRLQSSAGPVHVTLQPEAWGGKLVWQKAPAGPGEFLPMPDYTSSGGVEHDGRTYVATALGFLGSTAEGGWRIVPELYGRRIQPVCMHDGLLWAVEFGYLAALDPTDWSTNKKVKLPDRPYPRVVAVESDGFWCLEDLKTVLGRASRSGHAVIAHYAMDGQQRFRFEVPIGSPAQNLPQGVQAVSKPLIYWAAIDKNAVWLLVIDHQGIMPNDAPIYGFRGFIRIDRSTGKRQTVEAHVSSPVLKLPDRLLWLTPGQTRQPPINSFQQVYQLDKEKMEVSIAGKVDAPRTASIATDAKNLWLFHGKPYVFALEDLRPVPLEKAGPCPPGAPPDPCSLSQFHILAADGHRVWLIGPDTRILELADDGSAAAWDLSRWVPSSENVCYAVARPGVLYFVAGGHVIRLRSGGADAMARNLGGTPHTGLYHLAAGGLVWMQTYYRGPITTLSPEDLSEVAAFEAEGVAQMHFQLGIAAGQSYYAFCPSPNRFVAIDGRTGEVTEVESWRKHVEKWCRKHLEREPSESDLTRLSTPDAAATTPDGHLRFRFWAPSSPYRRSQPRLTEWRYDPGADRWEDEFLPRSARPTRNPDLLFDMDSGAILRERSGQWVAAGRPPEHLRMPGTLQWPMAGTERHFYARTPLGLYRVAWKEIQPDAAM